ncbi:hypothetical protein [Candidatus Enterococcus ikei]|uniref:Gram-positive cocci surface proteins LPxTG domain-containing protein n=1 Tax=Candidatus Enterococcus ikei TaxID=2815326 RepID=A0ABS3GVM0_9ENTE|nr:hypothetical protein [Enterococcus sp. DIV0869a]MBO0439049.1 hypothetical protein [Enterococcus sp. DIV0869a]
MKKYVVLLFFLIISCGILYGDKVEAASKMDQTNLSITFLQGAPLKPEPPIIKEPTLLVGDTQIKSTGKLPSTGDLITSLIWTLLGFSIIIVFVGVYSLKNIMLKLSWE